MIVARGRRRILPVVARRSRGGSDRLRVGRRSAGLDQGCRAYERRWSRRRHGCVSGGVRLIDLRTGEDEVVRSAELDLAYRAPSESADQVVLTPISG